MINHIWMTRLDDDLFADVRASAPDLIEFEHRTEISSLGGAETAEDAVRPAEAFEAPGGVADPDEGLAEGGE